VNDLPPDGPVTDLVPGRPDRVVHVLHAYNGRTIAEVVAVLAGRMAARGIEVTVAATVRTPEAGDVPPGVRLVDLGGSPRRTVTALPALRRLLARTGPAVVYAHGNGPTRATILASRSLRRRPRVVGIEHNHYSSYPWNLRRVRDAANALVLPRADVIAGVSGGVVDDLAATFPALVGKLTVLPPPLTRYDQLAALAAGRVDHPWFSEDVPIVVTVGHVHPRKDHRTLVRAMARVRDVAGPSAARLAIIGADGSAEAGHVRALIDELDLAGSVELLGARTDPLAFVARSTVFALSSRNEGMPVSILEAMALGRPIVSTDCPSGPAWILEGGRHGLLAPVGDATALGDALVRMLADEPLRERCSTWGRRRAADFSPAAITDRYLDLAQPPG
jgi:glycosyltransferase involved in cell wall biosynthesis